MCVFGIIIAILQTKKLRPGEIINSIGISQTKILKDIWIGIDLFSLVWPGKALLTRLSITAIQVSPLFVWPITCDQHIIPYPGHKCEPLNTDNSMRDMLWVTFAYCSCLNLAQKDPSSLCSSLCSQAAVSDLEYLLNIYIGSNINLFSFYLNSQWDSGILFFLPVSWSVLGN